VTSWHVLKSSWLAESVAYFAGCEVSPGRYKFIPIGRGVGRWIGRGGGEARKLWQ